MACQTTSETMVGSFSMATYQIAKNLRYEKEIKLQTNENHGEIEKNYKMCPNMITKIS